MPTVVGTDVISSVCMTRFALQGMQIKRLCRIRILFHYFSCYVMMSVVQLLEQTLCSGIKLKCFQDLFCKRDANQTTVYD